MKHKIVGLPWSHGLGRDVTDCTTSKEVMEKAKLNWFVKKCPLMAEMPFTINDNNSYIDGFAHDGKIYRYAPEIYATYRTDINVPLGVVKSKYEVVQNIDAFSFFDDCIGEDKALWQNAGFYGQGHKVFVTAKLALDIDVNGDPINNYLVFSNSHDGSGSVNILFTPIRVICTNCLNSAYNSADSYIRLRHTKTVKERIDQGARILKIACENATTAQNIYNFLYLIKMSDDVVFKYIADLFLTPTEINAVNRHPLGRGYELLHDKNCLFLENSNISIRKANQICTVFDYYKYDDTQKPINGTGWGAYNAITGYFSNIANLEGEKRMESLLYGNASRVTNSALNNVIKYAA